ncbi:hypothetical protein [Methanocaldococcus sp.]
MEKNNITPPSQSQNFMDMLEKLYSNRIDVRFYYRDKPARDIESLTLITEEMEDLKEFFNTVYLEIKRKIEKTGKKVTIYDDGRWIYIPNLISYKWFDPGRSIYAGYFAKDIPFAPSWANKRTYTIKIGSPELKTAFIKLLLELSSKEVPNKVEYKYIGSKYYPNIKKDIQEIINNENESLWLRFYRVRQAYELATSFSSPKLAKITKEELLEEIKKRKIKEPSPKKDTSTNQPIKKIVRWLKWKLMGQ